MASTTTKLREQVFSASYLYPADWCLGYEAAKAGRSATCCPYGPDREVRMNAWLSGHVTGTDERAQ